MSAVERWATRLAEWAIPPEILTRAPESPWEPTREVFVRRVDRQLGEPATPTHRAVSGAVLDVGAGAGAASLPCAAKLTRITAVDTDSALLASFAERAKALSLPYEAVEGRWPDVHEQVGEFDVAVCANVLYNVPDLPPFLTALARHARRVVVELTERHPMARMNPLWRHFHGIERPDGPTAADAVEAVRELGFEPEVVCWEKDAAPMPFDELVAVTRRRLCLGVERTAEVAAVLEREPLEKRRLRTLVWSPDRTV
ncbi:MULTISPECIES: class I SAM-dependent methyltransferase [Amycolatopsis]|nr:class I SAM-dependent methyltransferase [Amycolatopsis sacchari]